MKFLFELTVRGVSKDVDDQRQLHADLEAQIPAYGKGTVISWMDGAHMRIRVEAELPDRDTAYYGLGEDLVQVAGNLHDAVDGVEYSIWELVHEGTVRCSCGDPAVEEAEELLK